MGDDLVEETERLFQIVDFPSQPHIILDIKKELNSEEPNFKKIIELVSKDLALTAKILNVVNSAYYGLGHEVKTIERALPILGLCQFANLVVASSLHDALAGNHLPVRQFKIFFDHSLLVAEISKLIGQRVLFEVEGESFYNLAYMAGLFHDCGIPMLAKKFPDYYQRTSEGLKLNYLIDKIEENEFNCNHCIVGSFIAKSWKLPNIICETIRYHHHENISIHENKSLKKMLAVLLLAENIVAQNCKDNILEDVDLFTFKVSTEEYFASLISELELTIEDLEEIERTAHDFSHSN